MPRTEAGHGRYVLVALLALAIPTLAAGPTGAGTVTGTLAVTVEVVESCRVPAPSGLGTELAPCATGGRPATGSTGPGASTGPGGGAGPAAVARFLLEGSGSGTRYLTTIY